MGTAPSITQNAGRRRAADPGIPISRTIVDGLHIAVLSAFALAQPLFDILGRNPEFLTVRQSAPVDIITLALALSLVPGLFYLPLALTVQRLFPRGYPYLHQGAFVLFAFLVLLPAMHQGSGLGPWPSVLLALGAAGAGLLAYRRYAMGRRFVSLLTPAILLFPGLFLFHSPVNHLLVSRQLPQVDGAELSGSTPVVVIILDELPLSSLLRLDGEIDAVLFPGFAEIAKAATWYPNAYSVAEYTTQALPALLTGRYPAVRRNGKTPSRDMEEWLGTPTAYDYPYTLFTALGKHYEMRVVETVTSLCPETLCPKTARTVSYKDRMGLMLQDLAIVYAHLLLPKSWTGGLAPVDLGWKDFALGHMDELREDDAASFREFIRSLASHEGPTLYLHHSTLPHSPWTYLPSGRRYGTPTGNPINPQNRWSSKADSRLAHQRHMLQARFADSLLAQAIDTIKQQGFFHEALIVVTADHGASFRERASFRELESGNESDIINVPLFIKYPGQAGPEKALQPAASIDLLPTILQALGSRPPWPVDGSALQGKGGPGGDVPVVVYGKQGGRKEVLFRSGERQTSVADKVASFGQTDARGLYGHPHPELIDRPASSIRQISGTAGAARIDGLEKIVRPDSRRDWLPALVKGRVQLSACSEQCPELALVLNEHIAAVISPHWQDGIRGNFATVLSESYFRQERNRISLYSIEKCGDGRCLRPLTLAAGK